MSVKAVQYTVRGIPKAVDQSLRRRAREQGKSLNQLIVDRLAAEADDSGAASPDLQRFFGCWEADGKATKAFEKALAEQRKLELKSWR